jgi:Ca2+-binding RTX toxin-like protein
MPFEFSPVADNSLLPFATSGSVAIPRGDDNRSAAIDIRAIFGEGFLFGAGRAARLYVSTNGEIGLEDASGNPLGEIAPLRIDHDTRALPPGVINPGIWLDYDTERDSVVITWNGVGQFSQRITQPSTYQVELRDRGDGDAEIILRFSDLSAEFAAASYMFSGVGGLFNTPLLQIGTINLWDETRGNTGVAGVWQFRIENGEVVAEDRQTPSERLTGTAGDDSLTGGVGADTLNGLGGNDTLTGEAGQDVIMGGDGDNRLFGGFANDTLVAGDGDDFIDGGRHSDLIGAGGGNDTILSADGRDTIYGADGDDLVMGSDNVHAIEAYGGDGHDTLTGGRGNDLFFGGEGDDVVSSSFGNNTLDGGNGDDLLTGGFGRDVLYGGEGDDLLSGGLGTDQLFGGAGNDSLTGDDSNQVFYWGSNDLLDGGAGDDILSGAAGRDTLIGGDGNDILNGGYGDDMLFGGAGDDFIFGSLGRDVATGGAGADRFFASRNAGDSLRITDYNAAEGDRLVLDGTLFDADELRLLTSRQQGLDGTPGPLSDLALVRVNEAGQTLQVIFTFDNVSSLDQLILRLPVLGGVGETLTIDLF